ncbi:MAG TPA: hypothetical protein VEL07_18665 [Planctomycetota bacterium]|nr:hypothetical protein [Planctomycetota bacterium]
MRRAFTMLELLISVGIGAVVCIAAWGALRVATQTVSVVEKLSIENHLMREGVYASLEQLDSWRCYDDPDPGAPAPAQRLRAPGHPFARLEWTALATADPPPVGQAAAPSSDHDLDLDVSDPKTWYRGTAISNGPEYGNYALHSGLAHADADRRWYALMLRRLADTLGYYAMVDYMPAGTLYSFYHDAAGHVPGEFFDVGYSAPQARQLYNCNLGVGHDAPRDVHYLSMGSAYVVTNADAYHQPGDDVHHQLLSQWNNIPSNYDQPADARWTLDGVYDTSQKPDLLPLRPSHWPAVAIEIRRFLMTNRQWAMADIVVVSPLTGERLRLHIDTHTTTLRGARRARGLDVLPGGP